jgi:uncharacterized OB-fold protein
MGGRLVKCRDCGKDVSRSAKACPHCGAKSPAELATGLISSLVGLVVAILVLIVLVKGCGGC